MSKGRLEAFTDGVMAILITLMVLDLPIPNGPSWNALYMQRHHFLIYFISFMMIAIYWNNHHHMFAIVKKIDGTVLWANNLVILFLSFFPFITSWVSEYPLNQAPQLTYGIIILLESIAYWLVGMALVRVNGKNSPIGQLFINYRKVKVTVSMNVVALVIGIFWPVTVIIIDSIAMLYWFVPERQIERHYK